MFKTRPKFEIQMSKSETNSKHKIPMFKTGYSARTSYAEASYRECSYTVRVSGTSRFLSFVFLPLNLF